MKFGPRKTSISKSISARTTGRATRTLKKATNPYYGKKGMGWVTDPKRAAYNKVYNKTTFSATDPEGCADGCAWGCGCLGFILFMTVIWTVINWVFSI